MIAKTFAFLRPTRAILRRDDDSSRPGSSSATPEGWVGLPYIWNKAQTDAILDVAGDTVDVSWVHTDGRSRSE